MSNIMTIQIIKTKKQINKAITSHKIIRIKTKIYLLIIIKMKNKITKIDSKNSNKVIGRIKINIIALNKIISLRSRKMDNKIKNRINCRKTINNKVNRSEINLHYLYQQYWKLYQLK